MAAIDTYKHEDASSEEKGYGHHTVGVVPDVTYVEDVHHHLHRGLKSRQVAMIAIGGAIGTGLIIGTYVLSLVPFSNTRKSTSKRFRMLTPVW